MTKDIIGPAFPCKLVNDSVYTICGFAGEEVLSGTTVTYAGMTLRQYAAINAMHGLLANGYVVEQLTAYAKEKRTPLHDIVAGASANYADALLAELEKVE